MTKIETNEILLSIIIPTYNRYEYLIGCIDAITDTIKSRKIEIVVQDNSTDNSQMKVYLQKNNDTRVKYFYEEEHLTVSDNCNKAVQNSKGKYAIMIGDDDAVCDSIVKVCECLNRYGVDSCNFPATLYYWPDLIKLKPSLDMFTAPRCIHKIEVRDPKEVLLAEIKNGLIAVYELPRVYHQIISRRVLDLIYEKVGTYFPGPSPDMANAALCCIYANKQVKIEVPLMISGYGAGSGGGVTLRGKHKGSLKDKNWLPKNVEEVWDPKIPLRWLGCTIWPQSAIEALKRAGEGELLSKINYGNIYGETIIQEHISGIKSVMKCKPTAKEFAVMMMYIARRVYKKYIFRENQKEEASKIIISRISSLKDATEIQNKYNQEIDVEVLFKEYFK